MLTAWVVSLVGALVIAVIPDKFEASARIFVDATSRLDEVMGSVAIEWNMQDQVERVRQQMLSRPVLEKVARDSDLDLRATTPQALNGLVSSLQQRITIEETRKRVPDPRMVTDAILTIRFGDSSRETALTVVQTLLNTFVRDVVRGGQGESDTARDVVTTQIASLRERLTSTEDAIAAFKSDNVGLLPGTEGDYFMRLQVATEQLRELEADRRSALQRREILRAQLASGSPVLPQGIATTTTTQTGPGVDTQSRITQAEVQLNDLLLRFTDAHPEVVQVRQQLERLRRQREEELAALAAATGAEFEGVPYATNPVYQEIQSALNSSNVQIAELDARVAEREQRVNELRQQINVIPGKEAHLRGLEREYGELKEIHDDLVRNLERERLGTAAVQDDVNFSIIEEPFAGFAPVAPNRLLLNASMLVAGFVVGGGIAYLLSLLNPVFSSSRALRAYTPLPVLGSITAEVSPAQQLARKLQVAGLAALGVTLVVVFAFLIKFSEEAAVFVQGLIA